MKPFIKAIQKDWKRNAGAADKDISAVELAAGFSFPDDYKTFLKWSNGGEGQAGEKYLSLWPVGELIALNKDYGIPKYLKNVFGIGTDGGGESFALDYRAKSKPKIIQVPLGDLCEDSIRILADRFGAWLAGIG